MSFPCTIPNCPEVFEKKGSRDYHVRLCTPTAKLLLGDECYIVDRGAQDSFWCLCDADGCPRPFTQMCKLKEHITKSGSTWIPQQAADVNQGQHQPADGSQDQHQPADVNQDQHQPADGSQDQQAADMDQDQHQPADVSQEQRPSSPVQEQDEDTTLPEQEMAPSHASDLEDEMSVDDMQEFVQQAEPDETLGGKLSHCAYLDTLGFAVNEWAMLLCCEACQIGILPDEAQGHLDYAHADAKIRIDAGALEEAVELMQVMDTFPGPFEGLRPCAIAGLRVYPGLRCGLCPKALRSLDSMKKHHYRNHREVGLPHSWTPCLVQQINAGSARTLFEVVPRTQAPPSATAASFDELMAGYRVQVAEWQADGAGPHDARLVSPWLLSTEWHLHVAGHDNAKLRALVSTPLATDEDFPRLKEVVQAYFQEATAMIPRLSVLTRRRLNTQEPEKGTNHTPFHAHQQLDTLLAYVTPVSSLLAMLLRPKDTYMIPLPANVQRALDLFARALDSQAGDVSEPLHGLLMALWTTPWETSTANPIPCPTQRALALSTLKRDGSFMQPKPVTSIIAQFKHCMRLTFLRQMCILVGTTHRSNEKKACDVLRPYFVEGVESTFDTLCSLQHRASAIAYTTMSLPRVWWTDRETWRSMRYLGDPVCLDDVCTALANIEADIVDNWENKVLRGVTLPPVSFEGIVEDPTNKEVGYCFLDDPRNTCFADNERLARAFWEDPVQKAHFFTEQQPGQFAWNHVSLRGWALGYGEGSVMRGTRTELMCGGRGTEVANLAHRNTHLREEHNLAILHNHVAIVRRYTKTNALSGSDRLLLHSLDAFTAASLLDDLAIARPFAEMAIRILFPENTALQATYHNMLFVNGFRGLTSLDISRVMGDYTLPVVGIALGLNSWRHLSVAWRRKLCTRTNDLMDAADNEHVGALQSGHSTATENRVYGLSPDALAGAAEDILPLYLQVSTDWHTECGVVPGGKIMSYQDARSSNFQKAAPPPRGAGGGERSHEDIANSVVELLLPKMEGMIAAAIAAAINSLGLTVGHHAGVPPAPVHAPIPAPVRAPVPAPTRAPTSIPIPAPTLPPLPAFLPVDAPGPLPALQALPPPSRPFAEEDAFDDVNDELCVQAARIFDMEIPAHQPIAIPHVVLPLARPIQEAGPPAVPPPLRRRAASPEPTLEDRALEIIRGLVRNPNAQWSCPEQCKGLMAALDLKTDVLAALATGAGKSMIMLVPPLIEVNRVTVGVLPLKSLMTDYLRKLSEMAIPHEVFWGNGQVKITGKHNLVLVSADVAKTQAWRSALADLHARKPVVRVVFDEAHYAFTADDFRGAMRDLYELRQFAMQVVLLSGTVPPFAEEVLRDAFGLLPSAVVVRTCTSRPEIAYFLDKPRVTWVSIFLRVKELLAERVPTYQPQDRVLVFVPFIDQGADLANALHCEFYHGSKDLTDAERVAIYARWISGERKVMVCTSAFGAGNDYRHVRLVIHAGSPREMIGYTQEKSRAGRDGCPAEAFILPKSVYQAYDADPDVEDYKGVWAMYNLLYSKATQPCLRSVITAFCDGEGTSCTDQPGTQLCGACRPQQRGPITTAAGWPGQATSASTSVPPKHPAPSAPSKRPAPSAFEAAVEQGKKRKVVQLSKGSAYVLLMRRALGTYANVCIVCHLAGVASQMHPSFVCPSWPSSFNYTNLMHWRLKITYSPYHNKICFKCHVPQSHDALHPTFAKGISSCEFPNLIGPLAFLLYDSAVWRGKAEQHFGLQWETLTIFINWIKDRPVQGHESNITALFLWYYGETNPSQ
ncbi:hypothetical protein BOTBODRAFT_182261 [Botryobasidium botryosum FD-172 SS1]|uniref:DNA 3'-5' helicase n=1 Tax=Botryobasidium botryosum (strain FD-172 SS1) TaxID=930990 RepID=A0A067LRX2_BOTB1|nr:hypothetical protein BOTBODRAFT_182261 [Botryobasidium botryosum FD-172 SS1]